MNPRIRVWIASLLLLGAGACSRPARHAATPAATLPTYEIRMGQVTYRHYCQTCHGETGAGDGFNAFNLDPHPRDLSDPAFQKAKTDAQLADAVKRGGAGVGLSALMPPWGHTLSERQVADVVAYLRALERRPGGS
jgi:mono/diheme cytochrome c family protein